MNEPIPGASPVPVPTQKIPVWIIALAGAAVVIAIVVAVSTLVPIQGFTLFERLRAATELKGLFVGDRAEAAMVRSFGVFGLKDITLEGGVGTPRDYARNGGTEAAVLVSESGIGNVWVLGKEPRQLTDNSAYKTSIAVSSDGRYIAYAVRAGGESEASAALKDWVLHIIDLELGTDIGLGLGFEPYFFEREEGTYLFFTTPTGIQVSKPADAGSYQSFMTPLTVGESIGYAARISKDGLHVAMKNPTTKKYSFFSVYRSTADMPIGLDPLGQTASSYSDVAFANGGAYVMNSGTEGESSVWKINLSEIASVSKRYTFPTTVPTRFVQ